LSRGLEMQWAFGTARNGSAPQRQAARTSRFAACRGQGQGLDERPPLTRRLSAAATEAPGCSPVRGPDASPLPGPRPPRSLWHARWPSLWAWCGFGANRPGCTFRCLSSGELGTSAPAASSPLPLASLGAFFSPRSLVRGMVEMEQPNQWLRRACHHGSWGGPHAPCVGRGSSCGERAARAVRTPQQRPQRIRPGPQLTPSACAV
jgi:hypothetical protein